MFNNVTILLQGILNENVSLIDTLNNYTKICNVVLSVYKPDIKKVIEICKIFPTVIIMENDIDEYNNQPLIIEKEFANSPLNFLQNGFFQICNTKKGLSVIHTTYVVKSRIDHFYSNLQNFIQYGLYTQKIISSPVFIRGYNDKFFPYRYHLSDCLFMGKTCDIKLCFDLCYKNKLLTFPEIGIWRPYFIYKFNKMGIDINSVDDETYVKYMLELVDVFPIDKLKPYKIKICDNINTNMITTKTTMREYLTTGYDTKY